MVEVNEKIAIYYCNSEGKIEYQYNPNGSIKNIAGIFNKEKNVLGMMPHPERMIDQSLSGEDGSIFFKQKTAYEIGVRLVGSGDVYKRQPFIY